LIKTSGFQVWPREVEETLTSHPAVAEAGVAGIPDDMKGEAVKAWVVLRAGQTTNEADLRAFFGTGGRAPPRLDLVLLGVGSDGHTASLFPGSAALEERRRWVAAPHVERLGVRRITLTLPVLTRGREVLFLASGADKADAVARSIAPAEGTEPLPAGRVHGEATGRVAWLVDSGAAARLRDGDGLEWTSSPSRRA